MSPEDLWAIYLQIPRISAIRELKVRAAESPLNRDRVWTLHLLATGSTSQAGLALSKYVSAELAAGRTAE